MMRHQLELETEGPWDPWPDLTSSKHIWPQGNIAIFACSSPPASQGACGLPTSSMGLPMGWDLWDLGMLQREMYARLVCSYLALQGSKWQLFQQDPGGGVWVTSWAVRLAGFEHSNLPHVLISPACQTPFDTLFKGAAELQMGLIQLPSAAFC